MERYNNTVQASNGDIIATATITVYLSSSGALATIYMDNETTTISNPFTISDSNYDTDGSFWFKAANDLYDIKVVNGADTSWIYDAALFDVTSGDVSLADSEYLYLGNDDDLQVYHDSVNSFFNVNNGGLYIRNQDNSQIVFIQARDSGGSDKEGIQVGGAIPNVKLYYDGGVAASTQSGGIAFNGDTATANTIDDYEEGAWTPVLSDGTNNAQSSIAVGSYEKIGRLVNIRAYLVTSSLGSVSSNIRITGLPFTPSSTTNSYSTIVAGQGQGLAITAGYYVAGVIGPGLPYIELNLWDTTTGNSGMLSTEWTADGGITIVGSYYV